MSEGPDASWRRTLNHVLTAVKKIELIFARLILTIQRFRGSLHSFVDHEKLAAILAVPANEIRLTASGKDRMWGARPGRTYTLALRPRFAGKVGSEPMVQFASAVPSGPETKDWLWPAGQRSGRYRQSLRRQTRPAKELLEN